MIVLNQSLAQARAWIAANPPARVPRVDDEGNAYTTVTPKEWIRHGGRALAGNNLVLRVRDSHVTATPEGPVLRQSFALRHCFSGDVDEWTRDQALDTSDPLAKAVAGAETCGLGAAIKGLLWDVADDAPEPTERLRPAKPVEDSRTQAQIQEHARRVNGNGVLKDRSGEPVSLAPVGPATPITREAGWQTTGENPGRFGPVKGAPHTVPPDASMAEHLNLKPGDGLPATSLEERARLELERTLREAQRHGGVVTMLRPTPEQLADTNTDEGATRTAPSSAPQDVPVAGAEGGVTSAPDPLTDEQKAAAFDEIRAAYRAAYDEELKSAPEPVDLPEADGAAAPLSPAAPSSVDPEGPVPPSGSAGPAVAFICECGAVLAADVAACPSCGKVYKPAPDSTAARLAALGLRRRDAGPNTSDILRGDVVVLRNVSLDDVNEWLDEGAHDDESESGSDECDECDGSGYYTITPDGGEPERRECICLAEAQREIDETSAKVEAGEACPSCFGVLVGGRCPDEGCDVDVAAEWLAEQERAEDDAADLDDWGETSAPAPLGRPVTAPAPAYRPPTSEFAGKRTMTAKGDMGPCAYPGEGCSGEIRNLEQYHAGKKGRRAHTVCVTRERAATKEEATT